jgi:Cys-tRNA(Pro)/Cys-tRNA(Cys) deacylase
VGQKRRHRTVLDRSALDHGTVLVSAGRRGLELEISPADLVAITGAIVDRVGRD